MRGRLIWCRRASLGAAGGRRRPRGRGHCASFTFAATANSVVRPGARPVFADIEPDYFCLDLAAVEAAITPRTRAIMPVHLCGQPADLYANELVGLNERMTDIHAAIGREQLKKLPAWAARRQANAVFFDVNLKGVVTPPVRPGATHVYHQYTIRVADDRHGFVQAPRDEHQIGAGVYYPIPNRRLPSLVKHAPGAAAEVVSLPVHPSLSQEDLDRIVSAVDALSRAGA